MFCSCLSIVKHNIHLKHSSVPLTLVKQTPSAVTQTKSRLPPGADGGRASTSHAHVLLRMPVSAFLPHHGPHPRTLPRAVPSAGSARGRPAGLFSPSSLPRPPRPLPQLGALAPHAPSHAPRLSSRLPSALLDAYGSSLSPPPRRPGSPEHRPNLLRTRLTSNPGTLYVHCECFLNESSLKDKEKSSKDVKLGREDAMSDSFWKMSSASS